MAELPVWLCSECVYGKYLRQLKIKASGQTRVVDELWCELHGTFVGARSAGCEQWNPRTLNSIEKEFPRTVVDYCIEMAEKRRARKMKKPKPEEMTATPES